MTTATLTLTLTVTTDGDATPEQLAEAVAFALAEFRQVPLAAVSTGDDDADEVFVEACEATPA